MNEFHPIDIHITVAIHGDLNDRLHALQRGKDVRVLVQGGLHSGIQHEVIRLFERLFQFPFMPRLGVIGLEARRRAGEEIGEAAAPII